ncbi:MAG TPA: hypothetical protein VGL07_13385 [Buttiauxella sp.]|jgi:hypothetical protein
MDKSLPRSLRRLLVMCGIAAANHRLNSHADAITQVLPLLISETVPLKECEFIIQALLDCSPLTSPDCNPMLTIATRFGPGPETYRDIERIPHDDIDNARQSDG